MPGLLFLQPRLAQCTLQYRLSGLSAAMQIAPVFGFAGAMFPWTAQAAGRAFDCCDGQGGYEDCLEHHITADVAIGFRSYWLATGDVVWLETVARPVLEGIAAFLVSRATPSSTPNGTVYSILHVLPVDEWCDDPATGCLRYGINNAVQTNAGAKIALAFACELYEILGQEPPLIWREVSEGMVVLFDDVNNRHVQFEGFTPDLAPDHYICPEEVMYLSYPLGLALNTSLQVVSVKTWLSANALYL